MVPGTLVRFCNESWKVPRLALWKTKIEDHGGSEIIGYIFWYEICIVLDYISSRYAVFHDEEILMGPEVFVLTQYGFSGWIEADALIVI